MGVEQDALHLSEGIQLAIEEGATTIFDDNGCVPVHIIRPGVGKGRGRHLYEADMLRRDAGNFVGWRMYVDHQSPEARRAAGGLPRSVRDLGGRIVESHWDGTVPADMKRGYGQGAVVGLAKPVKMIRELIEDDPGLVEASISASATGVKPVTHQGQRVWVVEGISDRGSVDWVTEAGAGGKVAPLIESSYASEEAVEMALLESMSDDELREVLRTERPGILTETAAASQETITPPAAEETDVAITPQQLQEALAESPDLLIEALQTNAAVGVYINQCVQESLETERTLSNAERDAIIDRQWALRDMRDTAHKLIAESRLPDGWQAELRTRFDLREDRSPTSDLDLVDDIDADGKVTKTASDKLQEAVEDACKQKRRQLAEVAPTRVRGQGASQLQEGDGELDEPVGEPGLHRSLLQEAGIDIDKAYAGI